METKTITDKEGREIELRHEIDCAQISAYYDGEEIGSFLFDVRENLPPHPDYLMVTNMHLERIDGFKNCGIGTAIVRWIEELSGMKVVFGSDDGSKSEDGSHLTGNGPAFASSIYEKRKAGAL